MDGKILSPTSSRAVVTLPVRPFLNKLGTMVEKNRELTFVLANLAQCGGSRVAHFSTRGLDEPHAGELPSIPFEGILQFEIDAEQRWNFRGTLPNTESG